MKIYFRFNCGNMWGLGHLYRNLILIEKPTNIGVNCAVIINRNPVACKILNDKQIETFIVKELEPAEELIKVVNNDCKKKTVIIFIDRLDTDRQYIRLLKQAGFRLITYDDYDISALDADMAIITREVLIGGKSIAYTGPKYQLLRPDVEYYAAKDKVIKRNPNRILVHFGGTDPLKLLKKTYDAVKNLRCYEYEFIAGKGDDSTLGLMGCNYSNMKFEQGVDDFSKRIFEADLCIVAGGVSMYEAAAIGTPMINISHNEDQTFAASIFEKKVGSINFGIGNKIESVKIIPTIIDLMNDYERRCEMSKQMKEFVPGGGADRICRIIKAMI